MFEERISVLVHSFVPLVNYKTFLQDEVLEPGQVIDLFCISYFAENGKHPRMESLPCVCARQIVSLLLIVL